MINLHLRTLIASVVMHNYYRWFPKGKIVFMAHTKPLVDQQLEACSNTMFIPKEDIIELTGTIKPEKRNMMWIQKRVFFVTPQLLMNDLEEKRCNPEDFVLLIFDEAHKSTKKHSYCEVLKMVSSVNNNFRVLALTATPGKNLISIQELVNKLNISHIEMRDENDENVSKYFHQREEELISVELTDDIKNLKKIFESVIKIPLNKLNRANIYPVSDPEKVVLNDIIKLNNSLRISGYRNVNIDEENKWIASSQLALCVSLIQSYGYLQVNGLVEFLSSIKKYEDSDSKGKLQIIKDQNFKKSIEITEKLIQKGHIHPKYLKLKECVTKHFRENKKSKIMIFAHTRETVGEIEKFLKNDCKIASLVGQKSTESTKGLNQKAQKTLLKDFREGKYNTIVCTSVAEEGIDIGDVDLIICFDTLSSVTRTVQRMGRTGRKRDGKIISLATKGVEEDRYHVTQKKKDTLFGDFSKMLNPENGLRLYPVNRLIPKNIRPTLIEKEFKPLEYVVRETKKDLSKNFQNKLEMTFKNPDILYHQSSSMPIHQIKHSSRTNFIIGMMKKFHQEDYVYTQKSSNEVKEKRSNSPLLTFKEDNKEDEDLIEHISSQRSDNSIHFDDPPIDLSSPVQHQIESTTFDLPHSPIPTPDPNETIITIEDDSIILNREKSPEIHHDNDEDVVEINPSEASTNLEKSKNQEMEEPLIIDKSTNEDMKSSIERSSIEEPLEITKETSDYDTTTLIQLFFNNEVKVPNVEGMYIKDNEGKDVFICFQRKKRKRKFKAAQKENHEENVIPKSKKVKNSYIEDKAM